MGEEHQHRRQNGRLNDAEGEPVDQQQPVRVDDALQRRQRTPEQQRDEHQPFDAAPLGELGRRDLEDEVAEEEQPAEQPCLTRADVQRLGQASGRAD